MSLQSTAEQIAQAWNLRLGKPLPGSTCSLVLLATTDEGEECVLKVPRADVEERNNGPTLLTFAKSGGVKVLRNDPNTGAVLMPRLNPGTDLSKHPGTDLDQVDVCAECILRLRASPEAPGIPTETWLRELRTADPTDPMVSRANELVDHLVATSPPPRTIHGDLHHFNILRDVDQWVVIDPKGVMLDPSAEVAAFMHNPTGSVPGREGTAQRLIRFADRLGDPLPRLWGWSFVLNVLSGVWTGPGSFRDGTESLVVDLWAIRGDFA